MATTGLGPRHLQVLHAICEALVREEGDLAGTVRRVADLVAGLPEPEDRRRLELLLGLLDQPLLNGLVSGRWSAITRMDVASRERLLAAWSVSRLQLKRVGFQALKRLVYVSHYCWPTAAGTHPAWQRVGYPGPLDPPADAPSPLATLPLDRDTTIDTEAVVCGSGAGGGVVAGLLAGAGLDVVVLEMGEAPDPRRMTQVEGDMLSAWYLDRGLLMTRSGSMPVLAGSCLGGGTVINYTTSLPLPEDVRAEWDARAGTTLFTSTGFSEALARVSARLGLGTRWNTPGARDVILERGCRTLGWHVDAQPRNVTGCREGLECGYCGFGCRHGAKNSTERTYLADAVRAGARAVVRCTVDRVLVERGRATGVIATVRGVNGSCRLTVHARVVVAACGAIHTPALLARSGLRHDRLGRGLHLQPATAVAARFAERIEPWSGALQTRYSEQFARADGGYGVRFETAPIHFALPASGFGWGGAGDFRRQLDGLAHTSVAGVLLRDRGSGRVRVARDGRPRVHYELSWRDVAQLRLGVARAAELLAAAGALDVFSLHTPPARVRVGAPDWAQAFQSACDARGYRGARMACISFHQMGTAAIGGGPSRGVVQQTGETFGIRNLYVADGSLFPGSSGVNPMLTIAALADHVAGAIRDGW